jgi:hypothetical protein
MNKQGYTAMEEQRSTRKEITGNRPLDFSAWIRNNLPESKTGYFVSDLDFVLYNYKAKKLMMLEIKTRNAEPKYWQKLMWDNMDKWIKNGIDEDWTYYGFFYVKFENTFFNDGRCYLNGKEISELDLKEFLSF